MDQFKIKKWDFVLIALLIILCLSPFFYFHYVDAQGKDYVYLSIQVKGKEVKKVNLSKNKQTLTIPIEQNGVVTNVVEVRENVVDMIEANCPDQLCVLHNPIKTPGEAIVCLPNKVVLEIKGGTGEFKEGDINTY